MLDDFIEINGVKYLREKTDRKYVVVRTYSAGVWSGYIVSRNGKEGVMTEARRLWRWAGAFTLSELATFGSKNPDECKFCVPLDKVELTEIIEVIYCTDVAEKSIKSIANYDCGI